MGEAVQSLCKVCHLTFTTSQIQGELDRKGRSRSVLPDRFHQLAIFRLGTSQVSNDADRPRQRHCASPSARTKPDQQQASAVNRHPFLNSTNPLRFQFEIGQKVATFSRLFCRYRTDGGEQAVWEEARKLKEAAAQQPPGSMARELLLRRARQAETASHINEWLTSPGLQPPKSLENWLADQKK
jgi:hypothetical protein